MTIALCLNIVLLGDPAAAASSATLHGSANGEITVTWTTTSQDLAGNYYFGPVQEFVIRLYAATTTHRLRQSEVGVGSRTLTMTDVEPGTYSVWLMELNDSGLSGGIMEDVTVPAQPSPSPTPSPTSPAA